MKSIPVEFPFKSVLSLSPLIRYWEQFLSQGDSVKAGLAGQIQERLKTAPELLKPIEDISVLEKHRELVDLLMSIVFSRAFQETDFSAAFVPFRFKPIYATPAFKRIFSLEEKDIQAHCNMDPERWAWGRLMKAYLHIMTSFYDLDFAFDYPLIISGKDPDTGLDRYFSITMSPKFIEIKLRDHLKPLSETEKKRLMANVTNAKLWMEVLPPDNFTFQGFGLFRAMDVTNQEVLSSLKRDLIEKESIFSQEGFERLQDKMRIFLRQPDLMLGLAALKGEEVLLLSPHQRLEKGCIFADSVHCAKREYEGSVYAQAVEKGEPLIIENLQTHPVRTHLEEHMLEKGVGSMFVAPLHYQGKLLGTLDLKSPQTGGLNTLNTLKLFEIMPLFSMALNRGMEELDHRIQAIIKEKCTAIHPSVEWRFQRAALNFMQREDQSVSGLEPIVFRDVYPLYGVSDIRGSSEHRNAAIQADLIEHLQMAGDIIQAAETYRALPIFDALAYKIDKNIREVERGLNSGDEVAKLDFIRHEIEPVFNHIESFGPELGKRIKAYKAALDPNLTTLYRKRKDYEEAVTLINETVSSYLEKQEEKAQEFFPHYFEKLKTDGVDHTIYIGASMVEDGEFDLLYLKNLRLWQLLVMCGVARRSEEIQDELKVPLKTTHLILVQNTPLSIRFRPDERRFDVDGAYDIRHEILKKRIDKAMIKGRKERLTQPGKIAIVFSHRREEAEYRDYIDYLKASGHLKDTIETLDLEDLQGVQGLKALRVVVDTKTASMGDHVEPEVIKEAVRAMG